MAHTKQQRKRIRQDSGRKDVNIAQKSEIRTAVKKLETSIAAGDKQTVVENFKKAMSLLARGARKGIVSKGAAARKVSRMAARIGGGK